MNLTRFDEKIAAELPSLPGMGITTVKTFTAYNTACAFRMAIFSRPCGSRAITACW